ncbi:hypothetical protein ACJJTC_007248 [Scirpophaga incertulas]
MSEEKELIKRRASYKGRLTLFTNYLKSLQTPVSDSDARELQVRMGHYANTCKKPGCKICKRRHNILVHVGEPKSVVKVHNDLSDEPENSVELSALATHNNSTNSAATVDSSVALSANIVSPHSQIQSRDILLSIALIKLVDKDNQDHIVPAILDSGSTSSLMTKYLSQT